MKRPLALILSLLVGCIWFVPSVKAETLVWNVSNWDSAHWSKPVVLRIAKTGTGSGFVTGDGVACGELCEVLVDSGTRVELHAAADLGMYFLGWDASVCSGNSSCQFRLMESQTLGAEFVALSTQDPEPIDIPVYRDAETGAFVESAPIAIQGIDGPVLVSIAEGEISLNCTGEYTTSDVLVYPGDSICVRHFVDGEPGSEVRTTVRIGNVTFDFVSIIQEAGAQRRRSILNLMIIILQDD